MKRLPTLLVVYEGNFCEVWDVVIGREMCAMEKRWRKGNGKGNVRFLE